MSQGQFFWKIANERRAFENAASEYTIFDALYEYTKNLEEQKADSINIDFNYSKNRIVISGNSMGIDDRRLEKISQSGYVSEKDEKHFGIGLLSFLRFSKEMIFITKQRNRKYIVSCSISDDGTKLCSHTGRPRELEGYEERQYEDACGRLRKWENGSSYIFTNVGKKNTGQFKQIFDMKTEFHETTFTRWFQEKNDFNLKRFSYKVKFGDGKQKRIKSKLGKGIHLIFSIPSKKYPYEDGADKKYLFEEMKKFYELKVDFDLWVSSSHKRKIQIYEEGQNGLNLAEQFKNSLKVSSVFRNSELAKFLTGAVNFKIKACDGGFPMAVYSGSRSKLLLGNAFGYCISRILEYADEEIVRPVVEEYKEKNIMKIDERRSNEITSTLLAFFRETDCGNLLEAKSDDKVPILRTVTCPGCKLSKEPKVVTTKRFVDMKDKDKKGEIFDVLGNDFYKCYVCGSNWKKRSYGKSERKSSNKKPMADHPMNGEGKERQRLKGFGYKVSVQPFEKDDPRRYRFFGTQIEINSRHRDHITLKKRTEKTHSMPNCIKPYEHRLALTAICEDKMENASTQEVLAMHDKLMSSFEVWYYLEYNTRSYKKEIEKNNEKRIVKTNSKKEKNLKKESKLSIENLKNKFNKKVSA